jgi:hypothetical protein
MKMMSTLTDSISHNMHKDGDNIILKHMSTQVPQRPQMLIRLGILSILWIEMAGFLQLMAPRVSLALTATNVMVMTRHPVHSIRFMTQCIDPPISLKTESDDEQDTKKKKRKRNQSPPPPPPLQQPSDFPDWAYEPRSFFRFEILHESKKSGARVGRIHTPHGAVDTPGFVAVATNGALKAVDFRDADEAGQQLVFCNTYHLLLHPGSEIIRDAGGIHKFTNRNEPFITDSGGFQVFSLAYGSVHEELSSKGELKRARVKKGPAGKKGFRPEVIGKDAVKVTEEGALFRSYRDGSKFMLTPETTVQAQKDIGADIIIPLDELPPYHIDRQVLSESVDRYDIVCSMVIVVILPLLRRVSAFAILMPSDIILLVGLIDGRGEVYRST